MLAVEGREEKIKQDWPLVDTTEIGWRTHVGGIHCAIPSTFLYVLKFPQLKFFKLAKVQMKKIWYSSIPHIIYQDKF